MPSKQHQYETEKLIAGLIEHYGPDDVWNQETFDSLFMPLHHQYPICVAKRKSDDRTLTFRYYHSPRVYYRMIDL